MLTSFTAASTTDLNAAIQAIDFSGASSAPNTVYTISFSSNFTLGSQVYAINLDAGDMLAIQGNGFALDGGSQYNVCFDYTGAVSISDLVINHANAMGGAGTNTITFGSNTTQDSILLQQGRLGPGVWLQADQRQPARPPPGAGA